MSGETVHLIDGTYELFRAWFGAPSYRNAEGREVGASRVFVRSLLRWLQAQDVRAAGCAFDTVIESFRNDLFDGYKTGEGLDPALTQQFALAEQAAAALGLTVWPMVEFEADDALATAAAQLGCDPRIGRVVIVSPDKDLCQCVVEDRVVTLDRARDCYLDAEGVRVKFGVSPESIPDYLSLVGDSADGVPGIPRWGKKTASAVLSRYEHLEGISDDYGQWGVRGGAALKQSLREHWSMALLYRTLCTLRRDVPLCATLEALRITSAAEADVMRLGVELGDPALPALIRQLPK
jgi:5'-3' exonuclease